MSNAPPNWVFSMFSFAGFLMCMIPLPWHLQAWNTGTCMYMIWNALSCLNYFINSIIWNGNVENVAPVWCDISTRIIIGQAVAIPVASLCINRRLYLISSSNTVMTTKAEKRRSVIIDLVICMGVPLLAMICQYVVSGHRFDIYEDVGCYQYTWNTPLAFVLVSIWPLVIGLISSVYSVLSIIAFMKRRAQFKELLSAHNISSNRYFRLMTIAGINILTVTPLAIYFVHYNATVPVVSPWVSWADTHFHYSKVVQYPGIMWRFVPAVEAALEMSRWLCVFEAFLFFGLFGFAEEAIKNYKLAITTISKKTGVMTRSMSDTLTSSTGGKTKGFTSTTDTLPVFVTKEASSQRHRADSVASDSFTNMTASYSFDEKTGHGMMPDLVLNDVGGTLKVDDAPASPSSTSSSSSSRKSFDIEVSSRVV